MHADAICALANAPDPEAAVHEALGEDVAVVPYLRPGFELSKRVADLAGARAVVLAHHGLVTWGDTHEESYELTLELVERASRVPRRARAETEPPRARRPAWSSASSSRCAGGCRANGRVVLAAGRGQRALADRPDVTRIAARRSTPDHMLRIGARSCVVGARREIRPTSRSRAGSSSYPASAAVARRPGRANGRGCALEIAAHSHASVAATLDRFGDASWLDEEEVRDFVDWPLELYKLTLAPPPPELAGQIVLVTGAASGIGRDVARRPRRAAARTWCSPTSTRRARVPPASA